MKIYISGSISAQPLEEARERFREAQQILEAEGHTTVCPFDNCLPRQASWEKHLAIDIIMLLGCDAIYMLQGWEISRGATLERMVALETGKTLMYEKQPELERAKDAIAMTTAHSFCDLMGESRNRSLVNARIIFAHHCATTGMTVAEIAEQLQKDTSTIGYYLRQYDTYMRFNAHFARYAARFRTTLEDLEEEAHKGQDPHETESTTNNNQ